MKSNQFGSIIFVLSEPSIKSNVPEMVLTLAFVTIKFIKICFFSKDCMRGCAVSKTYITIIHLEIQ